MNDILGMVKFLEKLDNFPLLHRGNLGQFYALLSLQIKTIQIKEI
uniref:Uncharacterized protein n=1 Tax=Arundo donax TaxID=35708 RepID=A0A0A8YCW8_ARUDO